mgnify:CR=1 FL=1
MSSNMHKLYEEALRGDLRALSRIVTFIEFPGEADPIIYSEIMRDLMKRGGRAHVIGVTGSPGVGKSTLISKLINYYRRNHDEKLAVITIDPSSPFSKGSFMGNRIRMQQHSNDPGVFIRSTATRGALGGLGISVPLLIEAFDGLGFDRIIIESVGIGQVDIDISRVSHTLINVLIPGAGDDIQALKAGAMEIGDIFVVNKADKPEADIVYKQLREVLYMDEIESRSGWKPSIYKVSALMGDGLEDLVSGIEKHKKYLLETNRFREIVDSRRVYALRLISKYLLERYFDKFFERNSREVIRLIVSGEKDPYTSSIEILKEFLKSQRIA